MVHTEKIRYTDIRGTTSRGCPWYERGLCWADDCRKPGHEVCIGTKMCDSFWIWFLAECNLQRIKKED